jgi:hypothetical protein
VTLSAVEGQRVGKLTGVTGTPSHLVLDRQGKLLKAEAYAELWKAQQYGADCSIREGGVSEG